MPLRAVAQLGVDFVADHDQIMTDDNLRQLFQLLAAHHRAGGVVGIGQDDALGARRNGRIHRLRGEGEGVGLVGGHGHGATAGKDNAGGVADVAGLRDEDFIAGVGNQPQAEVDALACAHGNQNFVFGVVLKLEAVFHIARDFLAQRGQAPVAGVLRFAVQQAVDGRVADVVGGYKVRLAHAQRNGAGHGGGHVKKLADAAFGHGGNFRVHVAVGFKAHAVTTSLLSSSLLSKMTPSDL